MNLDYDQIDPLLLDALEGFPPLDITRNNISAVREMLYVRPAPPKPDGIIENHETIDTVKGEVDV